MKLFQSYRHSLPRIIRNCFREGRARKPSEKRNGGARCSQTTASTRPLAPQHDPSFLASPGPVLARTEVEPGREVAVEFNAPHPTFFRGTVRRCRARNARVLFADGETLDVDYGLLRRVV